MQEIKPNDTHCQCEPILFDIFNILLKITSQINLLNAYIEVFLYALEIKKTLFLCCLA